MELVLGDKCEFIKMFNRDKIILSSEKIEIVKIFLLDDGFEFNENEELLSKGFVMK